VARCAPEQGSTKCSGTNNFFDLETKPDLTLQTKLQTKPTPISIAWCPNLLSQQSSDLTL
jgi:hypothetical protein